MIRTRQLRLVCACALLAVLTAAGGAGAAGAEEYRMKTASETFTESSKELFNPNRGFFHLHGFAIEDEETDYQENLAYRFCRDKETALTGIQINLREYRDGPISEKGMANLERLFAELARLDKQLVIRVLYDWDGKNEVTEPETREVIAGHMQQLGPLLRAYSDHIFVVQGLFVGDCGEMHGSKFLSEKDLRYLAGQLAKATDESTYLAVRTPAHWRRINQLSGAEELEDGSLSARMGLFNDGMLGSGNDCGTYGTGTLKKDGPYVNWRRADELAFQDALCRTAPNGGEVILDNPFNDFENAAADMAAMHVTYISRDYDGKVLKKWADTKVTEKGCFNGMDALTYMERHLGYRLVIRDAKLKRDQKENALSVEVTIQNVGFAPIYKQAEARLVLWEAESGRLLSYPFPQDVRDLAGGTDSDKRLTLQCAVPLEELPRGSWTAYLDVADSATGQRIYFGNTQEPERYGYRIGTADYGGGGEDGTVG